MSKVLLVTGAGRGIGAAVAILAAQQGYAVGVNYRRNSVAAHQLVAQISEAGGKAIPLPADVSSEAEVQGMFAELDRALGPLSALVNNAGILERQARLPAIDAARLQRIFAVNVFGSFYCARQAVQRMATSLGGSGGAIVNVSSIAARTGAPGEYIDYAASKGAMDSFTVGLAKEVAREGIRVNAVRPASIHTSIHADGGEPERIERLRPVIPLGRGGAPEEVARAILWLISEESSYCTGTFLHVTGGL